MWGRALSPVQRAKRAYRVTTADPFGFLPAVAAVPYKPVDPRDPHFLERFEEGGRVLARQAAERQADERRAAEARTAQPSQASHAFRQPNPQPHHTPPSLSQAKFKSKRPQRALSKAERSALATNRP